MDLLQSDYTYREEKGGVSQILQQYGQMEAFKNGGFNAISSDAQAAINRLRNTTTDWNDILFRDAFNQEYNLSISGGSDRATYYTSLGYYTEKGNVIGVDASRFNFTGKTTYKVNKHLKFGASVFANQMKNNSFLTVSQVRHTIPGEPTRTNWYMMKIITTYMMTMYKVKVMTETQISTFSKNGPIHPTKIHHNPLKAFSMWN